MMSYNNKSLTDMIPDFKPSSISVVESKSSSRKHTTSFSATVLRQGCSSGKRVSGSSRPVPGRGHQANVDKMADCPPGIPKKKMTSTESQGGHIGLLSGPRSSDALDTRDNGTRGSHQTSILQYMRTSSR